MNPNLLTQGGSTVDGTSFTTESVSSTADTILVLSVIGGHGGGESANNIPSSINGLGLTWQLISSEVNEYIRITAYAATVAGQPSNPGAVTITFPSNMHACHWHLMSVSGASSSPIGQVKSWVGTDQNPVWSFDNTPQNDSLAIVIGVLASDTAAMGSTSGLSMLGSVVSTVASNASSAIYVGDPALQSVGYTTSAAAPRKVGLAIELLADSSVSVPGAIANGQGLIIYGKRESGYNRPYTSGEIDGAGSASLHVPSYFRAEIVGSHMLVNGLWPAMLWYRPIGTNDGEIDVHEYMGGRVENQQRHRYAVTMHNEYGSTQDSIKRPIYLDQLSNQDVTAVRKFVIEKTPGQIKIILDDEIERVFTASDKAWWNRIMESGHSWYPRITLQIGDGASNGGKTVVPEPPSSWSLSEMRIHSYKSWAYTP